MAYAKSILRKIKLSKLIDVKYSDNEKEILDIFEKKLRYLTSHMYIDTCVYTNLCNIFVFEANHNKKMIYINKELWDSIECINGYQNTQKLFNYFIKKKYEHYTFFYVMPKY